MLQISLQWHNSMQGGNFIVIINDLLGHDSDWFVMCFYMLKIIEPV